MSAQFDRRHLLKASAGGAGLLASGAHLAGVRARATPAATAATPIYPGEQVPPNDPRYQTLVRGFNLRWVGKPAYVALCGDTSQVAQAVQQAVDSGKRITVRGGGHCYEDFVSNNDGGVIIDLTPMRTVSRDPDSGWYVIEGGATLWDVYWQLYREYGVTLPAGSCASVGAGGHFTGGGYGLLSRLHGLTIDYLHAVEMVHVTKDGRAETITISRDATNADEQDLMWGNLGGGGGNFGIVTRFFFKDPPQAPTEAWVLSHGFDWSDLDEANFTRLIKNYGEFIAANSGVDSEYKGLFALLHAFQKPAGQVVLTAQYVGDKPELLEEFARAVENGLPQPAAAVVSGGPHRPIGQFTDIRSLPWLYATQTLNGTGPNQRGKYKSAYMLKPFPDDQIAAMYEHLANPCHPNPQALVQVDSYGCQVNAVDPAATAVAQRSSIMKLQYQTYWTDPADDDANLAWIRGLYTAMYGEDGPMPDDLMDGCYVNYPDVDLKDWSTLYYKENYARLQRVKARWDPLNIFNHQQSIPLPGGESGPATPSATPAASPGATPIGQALMPITKVTARVLKTSPAKVQAVVTGELRDSCTKPGAISQQRAGNTVTVTILTTREPNAMCAQMITPFDQTIPLDGDFPPGTYTLKVNDYTVTFNT